MLQRELLVAADEDVPHQLLLGGSRIHAVVEMEKSTDQKVFRCFKAGGLNLYNGPVWQMLSDKRNIALLSDESLDTELTAEERSFLQRHVPWTRLVRPERTRFRDERVFLPDLLECRREELVVKNALLYGGKEVYVGLYTSPSEWTEVVRKALASQQWVVQEHIPSPPTSTRMASTGAPRTMSSGVPSSSESAMAAPSSACNQWRTRQWSTSA